MDAADRPVQKEPAAIARRRRSRGLLQQHTEQCGFDLHSTQKQTEMTGVFGVSTRSSSRAFIRCAARPEAPRTHRERRACAGTGATCQSSRRSCPRAVPRLPPSRRVGAPWGHVGLGEQPSLEAELANARRSQQRVSTLLPGCTAHAREAEDRGYPGNRGSPGPPPGRQLQLASAHNRCSEHRARVLGRASRRPSESDNLGTCVPRDYRDPDLTLTEEDVTQTPRGCDDERHPATGRAA